MNQNRLKSQQIGQKQSHTLIDVFKKFDEWSEISQYTFLIHNRWNFIHINKEKLFFQICYNLLTLNYDDFIKMIGKNFVLNDPKYDQFGCFKAIHKLFHCKDLGEFDRKIKNEEFQQMFISLEGDIYENLNKLQEHAKIQYLIRLRKLDKNCLIYQQLKEEQLIVNIQLIEEMINKIVK